MTSPPAAKILFSQQNWLVSTFFALVPLGMLLSVLGPEAPARAPLPPEHVDALLLEPAGSAAPLGAMSIDPTGWPAPPNFARLPFDQIFVAPTLATPPQLSGFREGPRKAGYRTYQRPTQWSLMRQWPQWQASLLSPQPQPCEDRTRRGGLRCPKKIVLEPQLVVVGGELWGAARLNFLPPNTALRLFVKHVPPHVEAHLEQLKRTPNQPQSIAWSLQRGEYREQNRCIGRCTFELPQNSGPLTLTVHGPLNHWAIDLRDAGTAPDPQTPEATP